VIVRRHRRRLVRARPGAAGAVACAVGVVAALVVVLVAVTAGSRRARPPVAEPPGVVLVSVVPGHATAGVAAAGVGPPVHQGRGRRSAGSAALDRAVLEEVITGLGRQGVTHGPVHATEVVRPDLARVLIETGESAAPCAATARWHAVVPAMGRRRPALVVVVGGTMRAVAPFARRAGLTCTAAGAVPVVLLDRRPVPGIAPAVVLVHEIGHAAGLDHDAPGDRPAAPSGRDLMAAGAAARPGEDAAPMTMADVRVTCGQLAAIAALLESRPVETIGRVGAHGRCRGAPAHPPPRRGGAPAA
jgi:hypothetical protein